MTRRERSRPVKPGSVRIDVWSDLVCPWCYLGKRRLETALASFDGAGEVDVRFHAFQLDPTLPRGETFSQDDLLREKYGRSAAELAAMQANLGRLAAEDGLELHLAGARAGNTLDAHRVVKLAGARGLERPVLERLFRAHFTERRSLFEPASLAALAGEAGLDPEEVRAMLADGGAYAHEVEEDLRAASGLGIHGVPFFVLAGRFAVSGAQPVEVMREALRRARAA